MVGGQSIFRLQPKDEVILVTYRNTVKRYLSLQNPVFMVAAAFYAVGLACDTKSNPTKSTALARPVNRVPRMGIDTDEALSTLPTRGKGGDFTLKKRHKKKRPLSRTEKLNGLENSLSRRDHRNRLKEVELKRKAEADGKTIAQVIVEMWNSKAGAERQGKADI